MSPHLRLWALHSDRQIVKQKLNGLTYEIVRDQLLQPYSGYHDNITSGTGLLFTAVSLTLQPPVPHIFGFSFFY